MIKWVFVAVSMLCFSSQSYGESNYDLNDLNVACVEYIMASGQQFNSNRVYKTIQYDVGDNAQWISVPVIDGLVPMINRFPCPNGSRRIVYDYRDRTHVNDVNYIGKPEPFPLKREPPRTFPEPRVTKPIPRPLPPRDDGWRRSEALDRIKLPEDPPEVREYSELPSTSPYELDKLPTGLRRPNQIEEPDKRIVPRYENN